MQTLALCRVFALYDHRLDPRHRFNIYWFGQTLSGCGDAFALVALPLLVLDATHSVAKMGMVSGAGIGAQVLTSLFSGNVVDRVDQRKLMIGCDLGRAVIYGLIPLLWWIAGPSLTFIYALTIVGGILANLFAVAYVTAVPALVSQDRLHAANARLQGSMALAYVLGTLGAGYLVSFIGAMGALLINAGTFSISAVSLMAIHFDKKTLDPDAAAIRDQFGAGMRFLLRQPLIRSMTVVLILLGLSGNMGIGAGITDLMIFHLKRELGSDVHRVGLAMGLTALGALVGAALAPRAARALGSGRCFVAGSFIQASGLVLMGTVHQFTAACAGGLLWGAGMLLRAVTMYTMRQSLIPRELLGRVTGISWTAIFAASALGTVLVTRIAERSSAGATLLYVGLAVTAVSLATLLSTIARRDAAAKTSVVAGDA